MSPNVTRSIKLSKLSKLNVLSLGYTLIFIKKNHAIPKKVTMLFSTMKRLVHTYGSFRCAIEKSHLATLRKKTGYTFSNCKKALEMHNNDLMEAEKWLKKQAQQLGWSKATKLEGRQTSQGLIGVIVDKNNAALVEINCETDFVARNKEFQKMVEDAANSCLNYAKSTTSGEALQQVTLDAEKLRELKNQEGRSLADQLALMIGTVGENATLKRALCVKANDTNVVLNGYAHPSGVSLNNVLLGRFGGVAVFRSTSQETVDNLEEVTKGLCQHIVGMAPKKVGNREEDKPAESKDEETCLIFQEYLLDDSLTVQQVLEENNLEIVAFKRFECGESEILEQPLELLETCQ